MLRSWLHCVRAEVSARTSIVTQCYLLVTPMAACGRAHINPHSEHERAAGGCMSRTGRRTKAGDLIIMVLVGALAYLGFGDRVSSLAWGLIAISVVLTWITLFMPTYCDVETARQRGCRRPTYGKLRACRTHAREKRDAVFGLFNLRNPGRLFRVMWSSGAPDSSGLGGSEQTQVTSQRAAYEVTMLLAALVSAGAAVLALF